MKTIQDAGRRCITFLILLLALTACADRATTSDFIGEKSERFVIQCLASCADASRDVQRLGGTVTLTYRNLPVLAVSMPDSTARKVESLATVKAVAKDQAVAVPRPVTSRKVQFNQQLQVGQAQVQALADQFLMRPNTYLLDSAMSGAAQLHAAGQLGAGVIVAVIDSGVANNSETVHVLADTVIGGENLVPGDTEPSATSTLNDPHGTMVGSMIAAHGGLILSADSRLAAAVKAYAPDSIQEMENGEFLLPMIGTAPAASIYAFKVFAAGGEGAPSSRVLLAMDRILTQKMNFLAGDAATPVAGDGSEDNPYVYDALDIQVVNLSLGGPALFPGFELDDLLTLKMLEAGITVVASSGNDGPTALTVGSPAGGYGALAVGAASSAAHERILRELQFGPGSDPQTPAPPATGNAALLATALPAGIGGIFRPADDVQVAYFSSRGPLADGRTGIALLANGVACYVQGADGNVYLVSGTSFSAPTVAGAAALLRGAVPAASAAAVRQALQRGANPQLLSGNPGAIDQGNGYLDIPAAYALLEDDDADNALPTLPEAGGPQLVQETIKRSGQRVIELDNGSYSAHVSLAPGEVRHFYVPTRRNTTQLDVDVSAILPELGAEQQNAMFGDDLILTIADAPHSFGEFLFDDFLMDDTSVSVAYPQPGLVRIAVMGDWTNAGKVDADILVSLASSEAAPVSATGVIADEEEDLFRFDVNDSVSALQFRLDWTRNWAFVPTHDVDLEVYDPNGDVYFDGATLRSPEMFSLDENITPGQWTVKVVGFMLHGFRDRYTLTVSDQDGLSLQPVRPPRAVRRRD